MPYALTIIGLLLIVTGARDTYQQFGTLLVKDFTGPGNFTYWLVAIGFVGALGYNETLRPFSRAFLFLIIVGMLIRNGGFFTQFSSAIKSGPAPISTGASQAASAATGSGLFGALGDFAKSLGLPALPTLPSLPALPAGPSGATLSGIVSSGTKLANTIGL